MEILKCIEESYEETYDSVLSATKEWIEAHPQDAEGHLKGILKDLYIRQGNDWTGRGELGDATIEATIAAYETLLLKLKHGS